MERDDYSAHIKKYSYTLVRFSYVQKQNTPDSRGDRVIRQRSAASLPEFRCQRDPHFLARREKAGRHAA